MRCGGYREGDLLELTFPLLRFYFLPLMDCMYVFQVKLAEMRGESEIPLIEIEDLENYL